MRFEYVNFIFVAGPTPGLSECLDPMICVSFDNCDARCREMGLHRGVCADMPGTMSCCCQLGWSKLHYYKYLYIFY